MSRRSKLTTTADEAATNAQVDTDDGKRRRVKTNRFEFEFLDNEEQKMLQQVIIFPLRVRVSQFTSLNLFIRL